MWETASWSPPIRISFGTLVAPRLGWTAEVVADVDRMVEEDYRTNL